MKPIKNFYNEGYIAFSNKVKLKECPYKGTRSVRQRDWELGWRDARRDAQQAKIQRDWTQVEGGTVG